MFAIDVPFEFSDDDSDMLESLGPHDGPSQVRCYHCGNLAYLVEHRGKSRLSMSPSKYVPHVHAKDSELRADITNEAI